MPGVRGIAADPADWVCDVLLVLGSDWGGQLGKILDSLLEREGRPAEGEYRIFKRLDLPARNLVLVGTGSPSELTPEKVRAYAARSLVAASQLDGIRIAAFPFSEAHAGPVEQVQSLLLGIDDALAGDCPPGLKLVELVASDDTRVASIQRVIESFRFRNSAQTPAAPAGIREAARADSIDFVALARAALDQGDLLAAYSLTQEASARGVETADLHYLEVLALARMGDTLEAQRRYERHGLGMMRAEDAQSLGARLLKDSAFKAPAESRAQRMRTAAEAYAAIAERGGGHFPLINAATLAWLSGDLQSARFRASKVLRLKDVRIAGDYWTCASKAEALFILEKNDEALVAVRQALECEGATPGSRSTTVHQFERLIAARPDDAKGDELLELLRPPPIAHYCGHIFLADPVTESTLERDIDAVLDDRQIMIGYGALAAGSDILFAERLLARKAELHVILPFSEDSFIAHSVAPAGVAWVERFRKSRAAAASVTIASGMDYVGDDNQFAYGARMAMGMAKLRARHLCTSPLQISIFDGVGGSPLAGTAADMRLWQEAGGETVSISPPPIVRNYPRPTTAGGGNQRSVHAIAFSDFAGFSRLKESMLPQFWQEVMGRAASVLDRYASRILCRNTWGDALFLIVEDAESAADLALDLQESLEDFDTSKLGIDGAGMRVALHYGPMYRMEDPILGRTNYYGTEVSRAARLEPVTPCGSVYVTEPFAAILAIEAPDKHLLSYVGKTELAKSYGPCSIFRLGKVV